MHLWGLSPYLLWGLSPCLLWGLSPCLLWGLSPCLLWGQTPWRLRKIEKMLKIYGLNWTFDSPAAAPLFLPWACHHHSRGAGEESALNRRDKTFLPLALPLKVDRAQTSMRHPYERTPRPQRTKALLPDARGPHAMHPHLVWRNHAVRAQQLLRHAHSVRLLHAPRHRVSPTFGHACRTRPKFSARVMPGYTMLRAAPIVASVTNPWRV